MSSLPQTLAWRKPLTKAEATRGAFSPTRETSVGSISVKASKPLSAASESFWPMIEIFSSVVSFGSVITAAIFWNSSLASVSTGSTAPARVCWIPIQATFDSR